MNAAMAVLGFILGLVGTYIGLQFSERSQKKSLTKLVFASLATDLDDSGGLADNIARDIEDRKFSRDLELIAHPSSNPDFGIEIGCLDPRVVMALERYRSLLRAADEGRVRFLASLSTSTNDAQRAKFGFTYYMNLEGLASSEENVIKLLRPDWPLPEHTPRTEQLVKFIESNGWFKVKIGETPERW